MARTQSADRGKRGARARLRVLFAASEVYPLIKTGGLGDVAHALPLALHQAGVDVRIMLPAYRDALHVAGAAALVASLRLPGHDAQILETMVPGTALPVYLVHAPALFDRPGTPYADAMGNDWPDNAARFGLFCRAITAVSLGCEGLNWRPDVLHCNDWHTGLAPALLASAAGRPGIVFTIHSLAHQGNFPPATLAALGLPPGFWSPGMLEFYGMLSFIKGGLVCADRITTVSPTYAAEILMPEFGFRLDGLLRWRRERLSGILNGVDYRVWDPGTDPEIPYRYTRRSPRRKRANKEALQYELGLQVNGDRPLLAHIARLTWQKGTDLLLGALPVLMRTTDAQCVVLGSGAVDLEAGLRTAARQWPGRIAVHMGYDEPLAHRIQAGADIMILPSRFEPCGLTQLYSLRYGTVPVVRTTGGLADTVVDVTPATLDEATATGFKFAAATPAALVASTNRALALRTSSPSTWQQVMRNGMARDFSWMRSAKAYLEIYRNIAPHAA